MVRCRRIAASIRVPIKGTGGIIAKFALFALTASLVSVALPVRAATPARHPLEPAKGKRLIWADEFSGAAGSLPRPTKWSFDRGGSGWGNKEGQDYTPPKAGNALLDGHGHLKIVARKRRYTGPDGVSTNFTSARLQTLHTFEFVYGLLEARIRVPTGAGLLPTFWALGSEAYDGHGSWPASGEIDAMEVRGSEPGVLNGTIHGPWPWLPGRLGRELRTGAPLSRKFSDYGVEWSPARITFLLDRRPYYTVRPSDLRPGAAWPFQHPFFLLLNLTVGGRFAGRPAALTRFPATMSVDWVRVWQ